MPVEATYRRPTHKLNLMIDEMGKEEMKQLRKPSQGLGPISYSPYV